MKANVSSSALALLLVVACNRPDAALFDVDPTLPRANTPGGGVPSTGGLSSSAGSSVANGGTSGAESATGGGTPTAGGPAGSATAGAQSPPDEGQGMAGAPDGAGGTAEPEPPVEPVCGNGILEAGEQCDDAGHTGQDGCDASCKVVCSHFGDDAAESEDHHCYNGYDSADFASAQDACLERGGHLASISSADENKLVRSLVANSKWLGGHEDVTVSTKGTGTYAWLSDEPFTYTNWARGEPDQAKVRCESSNQTCYEHCISMLGDGTWVDALCDVSDGYVCEWEPAGTK